MSKSFSSFKKQVLEQSGLVDSLSLYGNDVEITESLDIIINGESIKSNVNTLEEAREYAKRYIENTTLLENIDTTIPEEKVAQFIRQYHNIEKITDTLVESYIELASSNMFTVDPVVTAIKESKTAEFSGKLQYELNDGSVVAINEATQEMLNNILADKNEIVEYMRESKTNFVRIIKELGE
jgi:hypothetical protein